MSGFLRVSLTLYMLTIAPREQVFISAIFRGLRNSHQLLILHQETRAGLKFRLDCVQLTVSILHGLLYHTCLHDGEEFQPATDDGMCNLPFGVQTQLSQSKPAKVPCLSLVKLWNSLCPQQEMFTVLHLPRGEL